MTPFPPHTYTQLRGGRVGIGNPRGVGNPAPAPGPQFLMTPTLSLRSGLPGKGEEGQGMAFY